MSYPIPRYTGEAGEVSAHFRNADQDADVRSPNGTMHYLARGSGTNGQFGLYRVNMEPRAPGPKAHFHKTISESFFVLSGTVALFNGERWVNAKEGDFLYVPEGGLHGFRNDSDAPASMLLLFVPGAPREEYFETLAQVAAGQKLSKEEWAKLCLRHDNYFVDSESQALYQKVLNKNRS